LATHVISLLHMLILQRHSTVLLKQRMWLVCCWNGYCYVWKWELLMGKNIGRGELSLNNVQKGSPHTCFWWLCWCIVHDYYFGNCLGVFEHDKVRNIGHYRVHSGYPQPFIGCLQQSGGENSAQGIKTLLVTAIMPWISKLYMPRIIRLLTLDKIGIFRIRGALST